MSSGPRTRLSAKVGSSAVTYPVAPDPASLQGGLRDPTHPGAPCGPWASSTKKNLAGLPVR
jgi:hypothetical protein